MRLEGGNVEYGPGQWEVNLAHDEALAAADQGVRLKYAIREVARRAGAKATFMAKPFNKLSGSSMHLHASLWKDGKPAFAPEDGAENPLMRASLGGLISHLPGIALYGSPSVNSYKRFELDSFAPVNVSWGGDNRTVSIRSLVESPNATRIELRTPASDANPYWAAAAHADARWPSASRRAPTRASAARATSTASATAADARSATRSVAARADTRITELLGQTAVDDLLLLSEKEWLAFTTQVSAWDIDRYLGAI